MRRTRRAPGLEARIIARTRVIADAPRRRWMILAPWSAAFVAVALLVALLVALPRLRQESTPAPTLARLRPSLPVTPPITELPAARPVHSVFKARRPRQNKPIFPTPLPITPEERRFMAFAAAHPDPFQDLTPPEPLQIDEIKIQPLESGN